MIRSADEIQNVLDNLPPEGTKFSSMTYEQGIEEALLWILGDISNDEFEYVK